MQLQAGNKHVGTAIVILLGLTTLFSSGQVDAQENHDAITSIAWNNDGTRLAVGHLDGRIEVVAKDEQERQILQKATGQRINNLAWHPDENLLASGSNHGNIHIWDIQSKSFTEFSTDDPLNCSGLLWSQDGSQLWAISLVDQPNLFVWDTDTGELISSATVGSIWDPQWNEDGTLLITGNPSTVPALLSIDEHITVQAVGTPEYPIVMSDQVFPVIWSPDGVHVAGGTPNGHVRVWNVETAQLILDMGGAENYDYLSTWHSSLIIELTFTPDGQLLQALDSSGMFRVWDISTSELLIEEQLPVIGPPIYDAMFSPDGMSIAYGGESGELSITAVPDQTIVPTPIP